MYKKIIQKRNAIYQQEEDGFSIHTLEISQQLTPVEFRAIKEYLYKNCPSGEFYEEKKGENRFYTCKTFNSAGIRLSLSHYVGDWTVYKIQMIITPRLLLRLSQPYQGIMPPKKSAIKDMKQAFKHLFKNTTIMEDLDFYSLSRVDFCCNITCSEENMNKELMRLLHKIPTFGSYRRKKYVNKKDKKKEVSDNKHTIQYESGSHTLVIYDKSYQMENVNLGVCQGSVLRFELQCQKKFVDKYKKNHGFAVDVTVSELLWHMVEHSEDNLLKYMKKCYSNMNFLPRELLIDQINASKRRKKTKEKQRNLVDLLGDNVSWKDAIGEMELSKKQAQALLKTFQKMGVSPLPLRKNFTGETLPGPLSLLQLKQGEQWVLPYEKVKYK